MGLAMDEVDAAVGSTAALNAAGAPAALAAAIRTHLEVEGVQDAALQELLSRDANANEAFKREVRRRCTPTPHAPSRIPPALTL